MADYNGTEGDDDINADILKLAPWTTIYGRGGNDKISARSGNVVGGAGNDVITGLDAFATAAYWGSPKGVKVDLVLGTAEDGYGSTDTLSNIYSLHGSSNADTVFGSDQSDQLYGGGGDDYFDGRGGADTYVVFFEPSSNFRITYDEKNDVTILESIGASQGNGGRKTLKNVEFISFEGEGSDQKKITTTALQKTYPNFSDAGLWVPVKDKASLSASYNGVLANSFHGLIKLASGDYGLVVTGWGFSGWPPTLASVAKVDAALLAPDGKGGLSVQTSKFISDPTTNGGGSVINTDVNGDGRQDIVLLAHNESPFSVQPSTVFVANANGGYDKLVLSDLVMAHDASLNFVNNKPIIFTNSFTGDDKGNQIPGALTNPVYTFDGGIKFSTSLELSKLGGMSSTLIAMSSGRYALAVGDAPVIENGKHVDFSINIYGFDPKTGDITSKTPLQIITPYLSTLPEFDNFPAQIIGPGVTHVYRVWSLDLNKDGEGDLLAGQSMWSQTYTDFPVALQVLINKGDGTFAEATEKLNPDMKLMTAEMDYNPQFLDLDNSGIETLLFSGSFSNSSPARQSDYVLLNDGTGRLHIAVHDQFFSLAKEIAGYLGQRFTDTSTPARFIAIPKSDGSLDFIASAMTTTYDPELKLNVAAYQYVNVDLNYNPTLDFTKSVVIADRNRSALMRTWAGDDVFYDVNGAAQARLDGGLGQDTAVYTGKRSDYTVGFNADGTVVITSKASGIPKVSDTLKNFETFKFSDVTLKLADLNNSAPSFSIATQAINATAGLSKTITLAATDADGDALTYTVSTPAKGVAKVTGSTLTYTPGIAASGSDTIVVTASDGKGGTASQTINASILGGTATSDFRITLADGWAGSVGGNGLVYGTSGSQDVRVLSGAVTFDASFNKGGDIVRFAGLPSNYVIQRSGSSAQIISDPSTIAVIPVGTVGLDTDFGDGVRKLVFSSGNFKLGAQSFSTVSAALSGAPDRTAASIVLDAAASARVSLMGTSLAEGQSAHIALSGKAIVYGTSARDTVSVSGDRVSQLTFDASFNKGGDTIILDKDAGSYSVVRSGSSVVLTSWNQSLTIPVGTSGLTLKFKDGDRTLAFAAGAFQVGTQVITNVSTKLVSEVAPPSFSQPAIIEGIDVARKYTKTDTGYVFSFSLDGFYFSNGILSVLPVFWPQDAVNADPAQVGKKFDVYLDEFAFRLNGIKASASPAQAKLASPRTIEVADFNGDGYDDVFIGDQGYDAEPFPGGQNSLLLGTKDGFVKGSLPTLLDFTHSSAIGDIDNDGDIDIFVGNISAVDPYFLINDGKAGFTQKFDLLAGLPAGRPQYTGSCLVDLDGDGKLELILGGFNSGAEILGWTGSKFEVRAHLYQNDDASRVTTDVLAADIDGDTIPEIVMMSTNQNATAFYDQTRLDVFKLVSGTYQKVQSMLVSDTRWNRNTYFSDMNDDGFLDIASLGHDSKIILNDHGRFFVSDYRLPFEKYISAAEMWDLNRDGKLDLVYTQNGTSPSPTDTQVQNVYVMFG